VNVTRRELAKWILAGAAGQCITSGAARGQPQAAAKPNARLGINIAGPAYFNTELPFVDLFRMSRSWEVKLQAGGTPAGAPSLDENGWVTRLPPASWAETPLAMQGRIPQGVWTVLYDGVGKVEMWGRLETLRQQPGRIEFRVSAHDAAEVVLRIWRTEPNDYVRNIRVVMPQQEASHTTNPWNPTFLRRWQGMAALRFMDFMETNNSRIAKWSERPRPEHATFAGRGVALELLIDLANRLKSDPWFCMPHLADDDYVRRFASMVKEHLDPTLNIYVEYSNEVWNGMFQQHRHASDRGRELKLARNDFEAGVRYTALRATQIFRLWEQVFGTRSRLVRVLASHAANPATASAMLNVEGAVRNADALSIAPYVGVSPSPNGKPSDTEASRWTLEQLFAMLDKELANQERAIRSHNALAQRHRLRLIAYEAGQHLVGIGGAENNDALTVLFRAANRHPRMGELYQRMYRAWESADGDLICHFSSVSPSSKWGSWGLLEYHDDDPLRSPKFVDSLRWAKSRGQKVDVPG
jgi:hypothetical protein